MAEPQNSEKKSEMSSSKILPVLKDIFSKKITWIILLGLIALIVVACVISSIANSINQSSSPSKAIHGSNKKVKMRVDDIAYQITETVKEAKFSILEIPYDGLVPWQENTSKGTDEVGYVAYKGTVKLGIDFSKVSVSEPDSGHVIRVLIPDVEITQKTISVDDYYFMDKSMKKSYNKADNASSKQKKLDEMCQNDLLQNYDKGGEYAENARKRAISLVEELTIPLAERNGYKVDVQFYGGSK